MSSLIDRAQRILLAPRAGWPLIAANSIRSPDAFVPTFGQKDSLLALGGRWRSMSRVGG
jgi:hypothetical protein